MPNCAWFGYPPLENSILAWGARAIFHPHDRLPLDILWDRQGHKFDWDTQKEVYRQFAAFINRTVLPKLQRLARYFSPSDHERFILHFDWPHDTNMAVVAMGSPNGSYGYFNLSVSLVPKEGAPEVVLPRGHVIAETGDTEKPRRQKR